MTFNDETMKEGRKRPANLNRVRCKFGNAFFPMGFATAYAIWICLTCQIFSICFQKNKQLKAEYGFVVHSERSRTMQPTNDLSIEENNRNRECFRDIQSWDFKIRKYLCNN